MEKTLNVINIQKALESIASEMCDHYCKFPDMYIDFGENEDEATEALVMEHCLMCPLVQFLGE